MTDSRRKGRDGESTAKRLLIDHDYAVHDLTAGIASCDHIAEKDGVAWAVEVKDCKLLDIPKWKRQAVKQRTGRHRWMLIAHIPTTRSWLVMRQGEDVPQVWTEKR